MRKITIGEETIYLTEKERRELLKRFDLSIVIKKEDDIYEILGDGCYLCTKYRVAGSTACGSCPLNTGVHTCADLMEEVVGDCFAFQVESLSGVWWRECGEGVEARAHIKKIHKALMNMERVGRRGR